MKRVTKTLNQGDLIKIVLKNDCATKVTYKDIQIVLYLTTNGSPALSVWRGKERRPYINYSFRAMSDRDLFLNEAIEAADRREAERREIESADAAGLETAMNEFTPGAILQGSWGYEQTNQEFWQVIERSGRKVIVRRLNKRNTGSTGYMSNNEMPIPDSYAGDPVTKMINKRGRLVFENFTLSLWDGREVESTHYA